MRGEEVAEAITNEPFASRYTNLKEFVAITVTNIYSSQRGCYLRRSHNWTRNNPPLSHREAVNFYQDHRKLFDKLWPCPGVLRKFSSVHANFNPLRQMFGTDG